MDRHLTVEYTAAHGSYPVQVSSRQGRWSHHQKALVEHLWHPVASSRVLLVPCWSVLQTSVPMHYGSIYRPSSLDEYYKAERKKAGGIRSLLRPRVKPTLTFNVGPLLPTQHPLMPFGWVTGLNGPADVCADTLRKLTKPLTASMP